MYAEVINWADKSIKHIYDINNTVVRRYVSILVMHYWTQENFICWGQKWVHGADHEFPELPGVLCALSFQASCLSPSEYHFNYAKKGT